MIARVLGRQAAAVIVALGVFFSGAAPASSVAAGSNSNMPGMTMKMPGMAMDNSCMESGRGMPGKQAPCKDCDNSCAVCTSCAVNVALLLDLLPVPVPSHRGAGLTGPDTNHDGIVAPPALPPPISQA